MKTERLLSAGSLMKDAVKNLKGEDIGHIKEIMIDINDGSISYAVLSFGGFLGMGDKYFAVPWKALEVDQKNETIKMDVTKDKLENLPGFDKDKWPDFADTTFRHSNSKPYVGYGSFKYTDH